MIQTFVFFLVLVFGIDSSFASTAKPVADSPFSRDSWSRTLEASNFKKFSELLIEAQRASFPSIANEVAVSVAYRPQSLLTNEKSASDIPEFRIEAAHYLALAVRSGVYNADTAALRGLAKEYLDKYANQKIESKAVLTLAHLQDSRDIPILLHIAKSEDPNHYRVAIYALRIMCLREAQMALDKLRMDTTLSKTKQNVIDDSVRFLAICPKR